MVFNFVGIVSRGASASLTMVDCHFSARNDINPEMSTAAVISHGGQIYARNVTAADFSAAIFDYATNASDSTFTAVQSPVVEHSHVMAFGIFPHTPKTATALPVRNTPEVTYDDPSTWAIVNLNASVKDNTPIVQAAIDSGARTVMLNGA